MLCLLDAAAATGLAWPIPLPHRLSGHHRLSGKITAYENGEGLLASAGTLHWRTALMRSLLPCSTGPLPNRSPAPARRLHTVAPSLPAPQPNAHTLPFPASIPAPPALADIRLPFFARGPGVPRGLVLPHLVGNVDLAPTW